MQLQALFYLHVCADETQYALTPAHVRLPFDSISQSTLLSIFFYEFCNISKN